MPPVRVPSRVLVTGASGFVATHLSRALLRRGHEVVGTVRSPAKGRFLEKLHQSSKFSFSVVPDIAKPGAIDDLLHDIDCVQHTASPFHFAAQDPDEIIQPALKGTLGVLESVKQHGHKVKRVVMTSSTAAVITPKEVPTRFTEEDWNTFSPVEVERLGTEATGSDKYQASKTIAERAAWKFVQELSNPKWDLTTICPPFVFGPIIHEVSSPDQLNTSSAFFKAWIDELPPKPTVIAPFLNFVDVRDVAEAHVLAMESPKASNERFIVSNGPFCIQDIYDELYRAGTSDAPRGFPGEQARAEDQHVHDNSKVEGVLGLKMTPRGNMVVDTLTSLRERWA